MLWLNYYLLQTCIRVVMCCKNEHHCLEKQISKIVNVEVIQL